MSETPRKRLVSKGRYVLSIGKKGALFSLALLSFFGSCWVLLLSTFFFYLGFAGHNAGGICAGLVILGIASLPAMLGWSLAKAAVFGERVTPITRHNTGHLPEVETLVRASNLPPSQQKAELLRAAPQGSETPAEELLRATANRQGD